jgi:hypothetical protein
MSVDPCLWAAPLNAAPADSDLDDELHIPIEHLPEVRSRIERLGRLTRVKAAPVQLVDTGRHQDSLAIVGLQGRGTAAEDREIVCVLHHQDGTTRVEQCMPMSEQQVECLAGTRALCEACRTVRPRKQTFIARERATGRTLQLGSSCLRPLAGTESAEEAIRRAQTVTAIRTVLARAAHQLSAPAEPHIDTMAFLAHAVRAVRCDGFRRSAEEDATWRAALTRLEQKVRPTAEDLTRADGIREWASRLKRLDDDDYGTRLAACLVRERLTGRELPLVASAVRAFNRHLYWLIRRERASDLRNK